MPAPPPKHPPFFCPSCGQKHRADLTALLEQPDAVMRARCQGCGRALLIRLRDEKPVCELREEASTSEVPTARSGAETRKPRARQRKSRPREELPSVEPGERVGRYTVEKAIARGESAVVYRGFDPTTNRAVALKVLRAGAPDDVRQLFERQMEVQANIRHPNIMPVFDSGALPDGRPFFATELLREPLSLDQILELRRRGELPPRAGERLGSLEDIVRRVLLPVADGIYVANVENEFVHGDLAPGNVLLDGETLRPYVTDFGRARGLRGEEAPPAPRGDGLFHSPEQDRGDVHPRTDVWQLGALLRVLISGAPPGDEGGTWGGFGPIPSDTPPAVVAIAHKAMATDPDARYVNARQMATDVRAWLGGGRVRALEEMGGGVAKQEERRQAVRRHLGAALWVAGGMLLGVLLGTLFEARTETVDTGALAVLDAALEHLDRDLSDLPPAIGSLTPEEAFRTWRGLDVRAGDLEARLQAQPATASRRAVEDRLAFVRRRFAPADVLVEATAGARLTARRLPSGDEQVLAPGRNPLPPGRYEVFIRGSDAVLFPPLEMPFRIRGATVGATNEPPVAVFDLPLSPSDVPATCVLAVGGTVRLHVLPHAEPGDAIAVSPFLMDRAQVTNAAYAAFLNALPEEDRSERVPLRGVQLDANGRTARAEPEVARAPVVGIRPEDARAYCVWRSEVEGVNVRLPTTAEWLLAAGAADARPWRGDLYRSRQQLGARHRGALDLRDDALEMTEHDGENETTSDVLLAGAPDPYDLRPLGSKARDELAGFRCARDLPE
jgi:hypothetical protein